MTYEIAGPPLATDGRPKRPARLCVCWYGSRARVRSATQTICVRVIVRAERRVGAAPGGERGELAGSRRSVLLRRGAPARLSPRIEGEGEGRGQWRRESCVRVIVGERVGAAPGGERGDRRPVAAHRG